MGGLGGQLPIQVLADQLTHEPHQWVMVNSIELMINKLHGLLPSGGLVSPSGGFALLFFD